MANEDKKVRQFPTELTGDNQQEGSQEEVASFDDLFESAEQGESFGGANQLNKTAQLTAHATRIASGVMQIMQSDVKRFNGRFIASKESHDAMDDLILLTMPLDDEDLDYIRSESEEDIEKMIRSQQSKRSRAKSKPMSKENYFTMMTGAVAENLLRLASGKAKSSGGGALPAEIGYTDEQLEEFKKDAEKLKKEIRNVQSKKSIMSHKAGFNKEDARWKQLLIAEETLKNLRDSGSAAVSEESKVALEIKKEAESMLLNINPDDLSADDAKNLLEKMKEMLASR